MITFHKIQLQCKYVYVASRELQGSSDRMQIIEERLDERKRNKFATRRWISLSVATRSMQRCGEGKTRAK